MEPSAPVHFHLPGLFEFYEFYKLFLPLFKSHRDWFYPWCDIASIYGAPADCLWGGGRAGFGQADVNDVFSLLEEYDISARLTFSNSLLKKEDLADKKCNSLCKKFSKSKSTSGVIVHSDLLSHFLLENYPSLYQVSSTTKVLTDFKDLKKELEKENFKFVVPDFRLNKSFDKLKSLCQSQKDKVEFLCNECCFCNCKERKVCYENVSRKNLGEEVIEHECPFAKVYGGYKFSLAKKNEAFIGTYDILTKYVPMGFSNFKIEGRSLGSALILEFLLYYMTKEEFQLEVREEIYLDSSLDLF